MALRVSAQHLQGAFEDTSAPSSPPVVQSDLEKLQELVPEMPQAIVEQVLASSTSIEGASDKLIEMADPNAACDTPPSDSDGCGSIAIPTVDNHLEYPELSSTVECAYEVLTKDTSEDSDMDDDDDSAAEMDEYVVISDADVTDWLVIEAPDYAPTKLAMKSSYAQACHAGCE